MSQISSEMKKTNLRRRCTIIWLMVLLTIGFRLSADGEEPPFPPSYFDEGWSPPPSPLPGPIAFAPDTKLVPGVEGSGDSPEYLELSKRLKALEQQLEKQTAEAREKKAADAKRPTIRWTGELQADNIWVNQNSASEATFGNIPDASDFRRARMGMIANYDVTEFKLEMDFARSGRPSFLDVYGGIRDIPVLGRVRVGYFFEPFSLERMTSNRYALFLERSLLDSPFAPARHLGVGANNTWLDGNGTWSIGTFHTASDAFGDQVGNGETVTGRITWLPWYNDATGDSYLHLGSAYSYRSTWKNSVRFRTQPEASFGAEIPNVPFLVDTGNIAAGSYQLLGTEAAWVYKRLYVQSEYMMSSVNSDNDGMLFFQGVYAYFSFFFTDDYREYDKETGAFKRHSPHRPFLKYHGDPKDKNVEFGPGAWELAARISYLDLNSGNILGGQQTNLTVGLNWYLDQYTRISTNWIRAYVDSPTGGPTITDFMGVRFQYEF